MLNETPKPRARPTCACGHDRTHPEVRAVPRYGFLAIVLLMAGASATPKRLDVRCTRCGAVFDRVTEASALAAYR